MTMRSIRLPGDLMPIAEMTSETWQYPENEAWSLQTDEIESQVGFMRNLSRIWPLIRLVQWLSPSLRNLIRGHVWEEDGRIVGFSKANQQGTTDTWYISAVGVLPAYRRRGIARKLVEAALDLIRQHGGKRVLLDMTDGNLPAYELYQKLGFEHFGGSIEFTAVPQSAPPEPPLPDGYTLEPAGFFDWRPRYELERRITPESLLKYEPVEKGRFRKPVLMRLLIPVLMLAGGQRVKVLLIRAGGEGQVVARASYFVSTRGTGTNTLNVRVDPAHPQLAAFLVGHFLHQVVTSSPGHRVELSIPEWMEALAVAAEEAGLERRLQGCRMGLVL